MQRVRRTFKRRPRKRAPSTAEASPSTLQNITPSTNTQDKALDQIKLISQLLGSIADGPLNVPVLKGVSGLVERIVTIVQTIKGNKADCQELLERICDHLNILVNEYSEVDQNAIKTGIHKHAEQLHSNLSSIVERLELIASRSVLHRSLFHQSIKRDIVRCREDFMAVTDLFKTAAAIITTNSNLVLQDRVIQIQRELKTSTASLGLMIMLALD
ncbi:hypothetical protein EIP86_007458 [Pleurotus ostreatoroseus]|nr:hypothetical protein EIP86_007458 [Pleurotus ostreatoroseus]